MSKVNIKPLADRVLVEPLEAETKTASGIIIPDTAKEKPQKGNVVAVGSGTKDNPITVKVGQTVLYGKYCFSSGQHEKAQTQYQAETSQTDLHEPDWFSSGW